MCCIELYCDIILYCVVLYFLLLTIFDSVVTNFRIFVLWSNVMRAFFQSCGTLRLLRHMVNNLTRCVVISSHTNFTTSISISYCRGALLFFICFIEYCISFGRTSDTVLFWDEVRDGLWAHRFAILIRLVMMLSSLLLTLVLEAVNFWFSIFLLWGLYCLFGLVGYCNFIFHHAFFF